MCAQAIEELRLEHDLPILLDCAGMARSVFYYHVKRNKCEDKYHTEKELVKSIFHEHKGRYGIRRICLEMKSRGKTLNHKTVAKLMHDLGLKCVVRQHKYRSYKGTVGVVADNILDRNFKADAPLQKCTTDVSQVNINGLKLYLSPIMDMYNGEILSYCLSNSPNMAMIKDMLDGLFASRPNVRGMLLHSDQGWHYQHASYRSCLAEHGIVQSMSRKGNCLDNAMMENFFGLMKSELLYCNNYTSAIVFRKDLEEYIEYYNTKRIKLRLGMSPVQYREINYNV